MKQAAKDVKAYESLHKRLTCPESKKWIYSKLESSKSKYYLERFSYHTSITLIIFMQIDFIILLNIDLISNRKMLPKLVYGLLRSDMLNG